MGKKTLAIGWDVGGWYGEKQGVALLTYEDGRLNPLASARTFEIKSGEHPSSDPCDFFLNKVGYEGPRDWDRVVLAVDAPLAVPRLYKHFICSSGILDKQEELRRGEKHIDSPFFFRECDRWLAEKIKKPLPVVGSWMGNNSTLARLYTSYWLQKNASQWLLKPQQEKRNNPNTIIEVYPAAVKNKQGNKKHLNQQIKEFINGYSPFDGQLNDLKIDSDPMDAALAAIHALAYGIKQKKGARRMYLPELECYKHFRNESDKGQPKTWEFPRKEGWIYYFK
jgi:hypothetical protein